MAARVGAALTQISALTRLGTAFALTRLGTVFAVDDAHSVVGHERKVVCALSGEFESQISSVCAPVCGASGRLS